MSLKRFSLALCLILVLTGIYVEPAYAAIIFEDGLDDGTFDAWTGTSGTPTVVDTWAHHGTYSMLINAAEYAYVSIVAANNGWGRVLVNFITLPTNNNYRMGVCGFNPVGFPSHPIQAEVFKDPADSKAKWALISYYTSVRNITNIEPATSTPYNVEVKYTKNSKAIMYVGGVEVARVTCPNLQTDRFYAGSSQSHQGSGYIDCAVVADAYIGPEAGGPTNYPRSASQGISIGADADRWFQGYRGGTQAIGFTPDGERIYGAVRSPAQNITLSSTAARILVLTRSASQAINTVMEALGVKSVVTNFVRSATQIIVFRSLTNHGLINLLIRVVDALGQALAETSLAVWGSDGELIYSDSTGTHGYTDAIPFAAPDNITVLAVRDQYQSSLTRNAVTTTQTLTIVLASLEDGLMNMERVAVLALTGLFYLIFVSQAWRGEFLRSLVYGAVSTVGWMVTATYWWTGGWVIASVTTFFMGIGAVNFVQLLYALFNYLGVEMAEQGEAFYS